MRHFPPVFGEYEYSCLEHLHAGVCVPIHFQFTWEKTEEGGCFTCNLVRNCRTVFQGCELVEHAHCNTRELEYPAAPHPLQHWVAGSFVFIDLSIN